jgi:hypothetical protein
MTIPYVEAINQTQRNQNIYTDFFSQTLFFAAEYGIALSYSSFKFPERNSPLILKLIFLTFQYQTYWSAVLDLAKLKKGDSVYFTKRASPKLVKRYNYNVIIVKGR